MCIDEAGVTFMTDEFNEAPEKSIAVALKFAMKRSIAKAIFMRLVNF